MINHKISNFHSKDVCSEFFLVISCIKVGLKSSVRETCSVSIISVDYDMGGHISKS